MRKTVKTNALLCCTYSVFKLFSRSNIRAQKIQYLLTWIEIPKNRFALQCIIKWRSVNRTLEPCLFKRYKAKPRNTIP